MYDDDDDDVLLLWVLAVRVVVLATRLIARQVVVSSYELQLQLGASERQ